MARSRELGLTSVAFPALGTGIGGFPLDEAARISVTAIRDELRDLAVVEHVIFALRGAAAYDAFAQRPVPTSAARPRSRPALQPESARGRRPGDRRCDRRRARGPTDPTTGSAL